MLLFQRKVCVICNTTYGNKARVLQHYAEAHNVNLVRQDLEFQTKEDFIKWKKQMENETKSKFIVSKKDNKRRRTSFVCHRSGFPNLKLHNRLRRLKLQGSKKINGLCPAEVMMQESSHGKCAVTYVSTHVGHSLTAADELPHLFIKNEERDKIVSDIRKGVPRPRVLDDRTEGIFAVESLNDLMSTMDRMTILTSKDVRNIESKLNIRPNIRPCYARDYADNGDAKDQDYFISQFSECILYYKKENTPDTKFGVLSDRDVVLVFMSPLQKSLLQKYGRRFVAMDGTQGLTPDADVFLHTIMVLDDDDEGFPTAFALSNSNDFRIINIFLNCVKEKAGVITPKTFMSDTRLCYFESWKGIMGSPETFLFCDWHVSKAWNTNLRSKIHNKVKRQEIRVKMESLKREINENTFYDKLVELLNMEDDDTVNFLYYFQQEYLHCVQQWAYCFRYMAGINTNMSLEGFHRILKYIHSKGKKIPTLPEVLTHVLDYLRKKLHDILSKRVKGKVTYKLTQLRKSHDEFVKEDPSNIKIEIDEYGNWLVKSFQDSDDMVDDFYTIVRVHDSCPAVKNGDRCNLMCVECNICGHLYKCSCIQSSIKSVMCKHIHAAVSTLNALSENDDSNREVTFDTPVTPQLQNEKEEPVQEEKQVEQMKKNIDSLLRELQEAASFSESVESLTNIETHVKNAIAAAKALSSSALPLGKTKEECIVDENCVDCERGSH